MKPFFHKIYEVQNPVPSVPVFVPAELPPHCIINFAPAALPVNAPVIVSSPVISMDVALPVVLSSADFSVVSSANFVPAFTSHPFISTTQ